MGWENYNNYSSSAAVKWGAYAAVRIFTSKNQTTETTKNTDSPTNTDNNKTSEAQTSSEALDQTSTVQAPTEVVTTTDSPNEQAATSAKNHQSQNIAKENQDNAPPKVTLVNYEVKYLDESGKEIAKTVDQGTLNAEINVQAKDLFDKGYELLDEEVKKLKLGSGTNEVVFRYGKSRELMTLKEFTAREVNYKYPLKYRNLDFTGRQQDLEDFVVKKIYQLEKDTGIFYGTKDQAEQVRKTMLNGSFQGAYFRYAINILPVPTKQIEGDKYELKIEFSYLEQPEYVMEAEAKIDEFYRQYRNLVKTDAEKVKLIQDWLIKNVKTRMPETSEPHYPWVYNSKGNRRIHFPASAMLDGEGVCLTYAMTFARIAERFGLDVRVIQGAYVFGSPGRPSPAFEYAEKMLKNPDTTTYKAEYLNHGWNLVKVDGAWHHIDIFHDINLVENFKLADNYQYFLQSDDVIKQFEFEYEMNGRVRKAAVFKAWNTNRVPAAPSSKNDAKNLPNLLQ